MFRRPARDPLPEEIRRAFSVAAGLVDEAQRALIAAIPTSRNPGVPLPAALDAFLDALTPLEDAMPAWHTDRVAHEWTKCSEGIRDARSQAEALKQADTEFTFEQLNARIGDVLYPLEAFADAERDIRRR